MRNKKMMCFFLQAANIWDDLPIISEEHIQCVNERDWITYPKGRITPNEILIEVKGKAEKVVLVPKNINPNTLVSGTLYKLTVKPEIEPEYILIYLLSKHGKKFRDRYKTNLLISYVSKGDLYSIPIIIPKKEIQIKIKKLYQSFYEKIHKAKQSLLKADKMIFDELKIPQRNLKNTQFVKKAQNVIDFKRLDAEFFDPYYDIVFKKITNYKNGYCSLLDVVENVKANYSLKEQPNTEFQYVELSSINSTLGIISSSGKILGKDAPSRAKRLLKKEDIIASRIEGSLSSIAMIDSSHQNMLASSGFFQFRTTKIPKELLFVFARTILRIQSKKETSGTILSAVSEGSIERFIIPNLKNPTRNEIINLVMKSFELHDNAKQCLNEAILMVENFIDQSIKK